MSTTDTVSDTQPDSNPSTNTEQSVLIEPDPSTDFDVSSNVGEEKVTHSNEDEVQNDSSAQRNVGQNESQDEQVVGKQESNESYESNGTQAQEELVGNEEVIDDDDEDNENIHQEVKTNPSKKTSKSKKIAKKSKSPSKYSFRKSKSPLKNLHKTGITKPPFDVSGNFNIHIPEYHPLYDEHLMLHYQHSSQTRKALRAQGLIDKHGIITEVNEEKRRAHVEKVRSASKEQKHQFLNVQKVKKSKKMIQEKIQTKKEKEQEAKRKRVLQMKKEHEKRLKIMQERLATMPKESQLQYMLRELDRQGIPYKVTDDGIVILSKSPSPMKGRRKSPKKSKNSTIQKANNEPDQESTLIDTQDITEDGLYDNGDGKSDDKIEENFENTNENQKPIEDTPHDTHKVDHIPNESIQNEIEDSIGKEVEESQVIVEPSLEKNSENNTKERVYRLQNASNNLFMEINFDGDAKDCPTRATLLMKEKSDTWKQLFTYDGEHFANPSTGYRIHHGNQNALEPFACLIETTEEKHQIWTIKNKCLISALDGKGLTIAGNAIGQRVDIRSFNVEEPPMDCKWELIEM